MLQLRMVASALGERVAQAVNVFEELYELFGESERRCIHLVLDVAIIVGASTLWLGSLRASCWRFRVLGNRDRRRIHSSLRK